jgi:hypothetical protein
MLAHPPLRGVCLSPHVSGPGHPGCPAVFFEHAMRHRRIAELESLGALSPGFCFLKTNDHPMKEAQW